MRRADQNKVSALQSHSPSRKSVGKAAARHPRPAPLHASARRKATGEHRRPAPWIERAQPRFSASAGAIKFHYFFFFYRARKNPSEADTGLERGFWRSLYLRLRRGTEQVQCSWQTSCAASSIFEAPPTPLPPPYVWFVLVVRGGLFPPAWPHICAAWTKVAKNVLASRFHAFIASTLTLGRFGE